MALPADFAMPLVGRLNDALGEAAVGTGTWDDFIQTLGEAFPAACVVLQRYDLRANSLKYDRILNIEPEVETSYRQYYHRLNPWFPTMRAAPRGSVIISERDCPARGFANTEFGDWLSPELAAASAVSLRPEADNLVVMAVHYSVDRSTSYDARIAHILANITRPLQRSLEMMRLFEHTVNRETSAAAMTGHSRDITLVVDSNRKIIDANPRAEAELRQAVLLSDRSGRLSLPAREPDSWLETTIRQMAAGIEPGTTKIFFAGGKYQIALYLLPRRISRQSLLPRGPLFLVVVRSLAATTAATLGDFATAFGLTPAEQRLCELLQMDCTLKDAAEQLDIAVDTVRQRLKVIFQKTDTHRQSELISLFNRLI